MATTSEVQENSDEQKPPSETELEVSSNENNRIKLEDLKVVDLKTELEKRDLDKTGVKSVLIERLKAAILKEDGNSEECNFDISSDANTNKSPTEEKKTENLDTNGIAEVLDNLSNREEKQDVALQLSIDEEEAQLNEESLMDIPKHLDTEINKINDSEILKSDLPANGEENVVSEKILDKQSTPPKIVKSQTEEVKEKKIVKTPLQNKSIEGISTVSPKVLKVIGKNEKLKSPNMLAKSLWITGLNNTTRVADLKVLFSKQGRVLSVKIVKSTKQTPAKCYGFVTMATSKDASTAIQNLHRTELNGHVISVEKTQSEPNLLLKKSEYKGLTLGSKKQSIKKEVTSPKKVIGAKDSATVSTDTKIGKKASDSSKLSSEESKKKEEKVSSAEKLKSKEKDRKPRLQKERDSYRPIRRPDGFRPRSFGYNDRPRYGSFRRPFGRRPFSNRIGFGSSFRPRTNLTLTKLREDRFQRESFTERREADRRREDELSRHRYIERKQKEEAYRLEREKEKLRLEREMLERERAEILKMEREKQRLERERLEREREELRQHTELRRGAKRPFGRVERESEILWEDRKKSARYDGRSSFHSDTPSSSRFEFPSRERTTYNREFERHSDRFNSQKHLDSLPRSEFGDRNARREVTIRVRDARQMFSGNDFRDKDHRRSFSSRDQERPSRREPLRNDWKHDRRVQERITPSSSTGQRRLTYY